MRCSEKVVLFKGTVTPFTRSLRDFAPVQAGQSCALSVNRLHPYGCFGVSEMPIGKRAGARPARTGLRCWLGADWLMGLCIFLFVHEHLEP